MSVKIKENLFIIWIFWHFFEAPFNLLKVIFKFAFFGFRFFSLSFLIKTLFNPWKKIKEEEIKINWIKKILTTLPFNIISRLLGFIIRIILIVTGIVIEAIFIVLGIIILILWITLPFWFLFLLFFGVRTIF